MPTILSGKKKVYFKIIDELDYNFVIEGCPVQVLRGKTVSDIENHKIYLSLELLNVGDKPVSGVGIQLFFYNERGNVPVSKPTLFLDLGVVLPEAFVADVKPEKHLKTAEKNVLFGNDYFIELTDSYFKRMEVGITEVVFTDGTRQSFNAVSKSNYDSFSTLNKQKVSAYNDINIYASLEERYPARVIPTKDELTWVCCCGAKNPIDEGNCAVCKRERDWQFSNLTVENLEKVADEYENSDTAKKQRAGEIRAQAISHYSYNEKEREEKERRDRGAIERAELQQKTAETRKKRIITIVFVWLIILAAYLVISEFTGGARFR